MTIFIQVAKIFLIEAISDQIKESASKDLSFFSGPRDLELAKAKRQYLSMLQKAISGINEKATDRESATQLLLYIRTSKNKIKIKKKKKNHSFGTSGKTIDLLLKFVDRFYLKAKELRLIDRPDDSGAFAHFTKSVTLYHARRIRDDLFVSSVEELLKNPYVNSINEFHQASDSCVNRMFAFACQTLSELQTTEPSRYLKGKNELGLFCIRTLLLEHDKLHRDFYISSWLALMPYYLGEYLNNAQQAVIDDKTTCELPLFTSEDVDDFGLDFSNDECDILDFPTDEVVDSTASIK